MLPELNAGGVERGTLELGEYLAARHHTSMVISAGGRLVPSLTQNGSRHIAWQVGKKSPATLRYVIYLRRLLVQMQVDILHVRSRLPAWVGYMAWRSLSKRIRPQLVTTFHGFYSINRYSAVMAKGDRVIAISEQIANHIIDVYGIAKERIVVIHRGVDDRIFNPQKVTESRIQRLRQQWQLSNEMSPIIMLPGRLTAWKGQEVFVEALSRITDLPWAALCVGDTQENSSFAKRLRKRIAEKQLESRIHLLGHCDDMPTAYMLADVVVSAASTEPEAFGRVAVEAQAMGKPIIATAHGGSLETVVDGETGRLINPCDVEDLAAVLREILQNPALREKLGRSGREWVLENFTVHAMCRDTVSLYHRLLQERGAPTDRQR